MRETEGRGGETALEGRLRDMLAEHAGEMSAGPAPMEEIVRRGRADRRRGRMALGAGLAVLVALPGAALAASQAGSDDPWGGGATPAVPGSGNSETRDTDVPGGEAAEGAESGPTGVETSWGGLLTGPADPERQLLDGIGEERAIEVITSCVEEDISRYDETFTEADRGGEEAESSSFEAPGYGDLVILQAWEGSGGPNQGPGPFHRVLAVTPPEAEGTRFTLVCSNRPGEGHSGMQSSAGGGTFQPEDPRVEMFFPHRYVSPEEGFGGGEVFPFRWAQIGRVAEEVDRVTVEYGGVVEEALVEAGHFATAGLLTEAPEGIPVVTGYAADDSVVFSSLDHPIP